MADHRTLIRNVDSNVRRYVETKMISENSFCPGDLKDPTLCVIPKKYLDVAVGIVRILSCKVSARLEYDEAAIAADASGERRSG